jgi:hypothetical protein
LTEVKRREGVVESGYENKSNWTIARSQKGFKCATVGPKSGPCEGNRGSALLWRRLVRMGGELKVGTRYG